MNLAVKAVTGLVAAALLAGTMWLHDLKPRLEDRMRRPIAAHGRAGEVVGNSVFSVHVDQVDVATGIARTSFGSAPETIPSLGVFLIVHLRVRSNHKPFMPGHVRLATRGGVTYGESGRSDIRSLNDTYQPMLWGPAVYVFEIPRDRLAGARLLVGQIDLMDQLSAQTDVDLSIDDARAARLLAHPSPAYVVKTP